MTISSKKAMAFTAAALACGTVMMTGAGTAAAASDTKTADINGYHLHANVQVIRYDKGDCAGFPCKSARVQAYSRFERASNNDRKDADYNAVYCRDNYGAHDSDSENDASKTTVTFSTGAYAPGFQVKVTCDHTSTYRGVTYTATTDLQITIPQ